MPSPEGADVLAAPPPRRPVRRRRVAHALVAVVLASLPAALASAAPRPQKRGAAASAPSADTDDDDDDDDAPAPSASSHERSKERPRSKATSRPGAPGPKAKKKSKAKPKAKKQTDAAPAASASAPSAASDGAASTADDDDDDEDDDDDFDLAIETDLTSRFVWRGMALSNGAALQPSALASYQGFTAMVFGNVLLNDEPDQKRFSSFVSSLAWTWRWKDLTVQPDVVWYNFFSKADVGPRSTFEVGLDASLQLGAIRLLAQNHVDVRARAGAYFGALGPEYELDAGPWTLTAGADVAYASTSFNDEYFGARTAALDLVEGRLAAQYDLSDHFYFQLHAEASTLLAPSLRRSVAEPTLVVGGVALGFEL